MVPKKRRRRNNGRCESTEVGFEDASQGSSGSSRSSSLLQFESLERTCATLSPSGYSYDSLEYSNRSNLSTQLENTSPDSLEFSNPLLMANGFHEASNRLRPYRSFESIENCGKEFGGIANGFSNNFSAQKSIDLSAISKKNGRRYII